MVRAQEMAANPFERDLRKVSDPLSEETRKLKRALLVWCLIAAALTLGDLFPSEITAFGLKVTPTNRSALSLLLIAVVLYHLVAFLVQGGVDAVRWYVNHNSTEWEDDVAAYDSYKAELFARSKLSEEDRQFMEEHERRLGAIWRGEALDTYQRVVKVIPLASGIRAAVDFLVPLVAGGAAVYLLARYWADAL